MCLGIPGRVTHVEGPVATVDTMGTTRDARLDLVDAQVQVGDWVLTQVGFITAVLPPDEALETLALFEQALGTSAA